MAKRTNAEIQQMVTDMMISALEKGTVPWHKPWRTNANGTTTRPMKLSNRKPYRGSNILILGLTAMANGYTSPWWGTYDQLAALAGMEKRHFKSGKAYWVSPDGKPRGVRKDEKSTEVVFTKRILVDDQNAEPDERGRLPKVPVLILRTHRVFNACQADALPEKYYGVTTPQADELADVPELAEPETVVQRYLANGGPELRHLHQDGAYYQAGLDRITLPERKQFESSGEYYSTAFHELGHSTGHASRLNREGITSFTHFGDKLYSKEELTAEMTSAMLAASTGVEGVFDNSASYVSGWLRKLGNDPKLVMAAAGQAQAAMDFILDAEADEDDGELEVEAA